MIGNYLLATESAQFFFQAKARAVSRLKDSKGLTGMLSLAALLFATAAAAHEPEMGIRVAGEGSLTVKPDQVEIDVGVATQAERAEAAASGNAKQLQTTLEKLRQALGPNANVKTLSYSLVPNYRYPKDGGAPTITSYTATNLVRVELNDLTAIGNVIDTATQAGANKIERLRFTMRDKRAIEAQALREAAFDAKSQAETLAAALGVKLGPVLSVVETGSAVPLAREVSVSRMAAEATTPIAPGTIEISATVMVSFAIER